VFQVVVLQDVLPSKIVYVFLISDLLDEFTASQSLTYSIESFLRS